MLTSEELQALSEIPLDRISELALLDALTLWDIRFKFESATNQLIRNLGVNLIDDLIIFLKELEATGLNIRSNLNALILSSVKTAPEILFKGITSSSSLLELIEPVQAIEYLKGARASLQVTIYSSAVKFLGTLKEVLVNLYKVKREDAHKLTRELLKSISGLPHERAIPLLLIIGVVSLGLLLRFIKA